MRKLLLILTLALATVPCFAQLATKKSLTLAAAKAIAAAAEAEAVKNNWTMVICVVDEGANLIYLQKTDGTQVGSVEIAQMKARTAIKMKRPSKALEDAVAGGRNAVLKLPDVLPIEGGVPLVIDGQFVGAIGVSGASSAQDGQVAAAGVAAFAKMK